MCINKTIEAAIVDRGVAFVPTVAQAIAEREDALAHFDRLIDMIRPTVGEATARAVTDAATGMIAATDREVMARLAVVMEAVLGGGRGQVLITPRPEKETGRC